MKVSDLIEQLKLQPQHLDVMVPGYEGGLDDIIGSYVRPVLLNVNPEAWVGPHEGLGLHENAKGAVDAIILRSTRGSRDG